MKRIDGRILGIAMAGVVLVSACGSSTGSPATSGGAPGSAQTGDKVTLDLWIFEGEEGILPKFKAGFEAANPNVTLEITLIPEDLYVTKLDTAFAAGSPPDVAYLYERRWLKAGAFLPLDDVLASNKVDLARFAEGPIGACQVDGKQYCIGSYLGLLLLLYDRQLFDDAGIPYPSATEPMSVDEYDAIARKLAKPDADLAKRVWGAEVATTYWWMDSANLFSDDGRTIKGLVDDAATIHTWNVLANMAKDGVGITAAEQEAAGIESSGLLGTHQLGMAIEDNTVLGELQEQGANVGVAPLPVEQKGEQIWASSWTDSWGVPTKSSHPEEAKALIAWIATEGNKVRAEAGTPPLDLQLAKDLGWASASPERQIMVDLAGHARTRVFVPGLFSVLGGIFDDAFNEAVGTGDAAAALTNAAPILQGDLDKEWESWDSIQGQ